MADRRNDALHAPPTRSLVLWISADGLESSGIVVAESLPVSNATCISLAHLSILAPAQRQQKMAVLQNYRLVLLVIREGGGLTIRARIEGFAAREIRNSRLGTMARKGFHAPKLREAGQLYRK